MSARAQPADGVTYAPKIRKEEALIDWSRTAIEIDRQVRAFNPWPIAETRWQGQQLRVWEAAPLKATTPASSRHGDRERRGWRRCRDRGWRVAVDASAIARSQAAVRSGVHPRAPARWGGAGLVSASARVRARAAKIVADVAARGRSLDAALRDDPRATPQERGLLRSLCYDSIRWYIRLDALLDRLLSRPGQKLAPEVRALAIVGLCQLLYTDIPEHAAVDETVNAARIIGHERAAGMVNAILRRAQREHAQIGADVDRDLADRTAHPRWFVDSMKVDWGEAPDAVLAANNQRPPFWIRVNRLRSSGADYRARLQAQGVAVAASLFDEEALQLERAMDVHELPGFAAGEVSVQDAAAQLAARLVAPKAGERVLDACAAPGGKTGHLLELAPDLGELVAIDVSGERLQARRGES